MVATVISHHRPRRKHGRAWGWTTRRLGALVVTVAALATATWLAPQIHREPTPLPPAPVRAELPAMPAHLPALAEVNVAADLAGGPPPAPRRARHGVPLNATTHAQPDGYEVLSAAELSAISQARN